MTFVQICALVPDVKPALVATEIFPTLLGVDNIEKVPRITFNLLSQRSLLKH